MPVCRQSPSPLCLENRFEQKLSSGCNSKIFMGNNYRGSASTATMNLFEQGDSELEANEESDGREDFDEGIEAYIPKGEEDRDVPPWWIFEGFL